MDQESVLYRRVLCPAVGEEVFQLLVPIASWHEVLTLLHQEHGHQGIEHTMELLQQWCYWLGMMAEVVKWCQECERFQLIKDTQQVARGFRGHL